MYRIPIWIPGSLRLCLREFLLSSANTIASVGGGMLSFPKTQKDRNDLMSTDKWLNALYKANARRIYRIAAYMLYDRLGHTTDAQDVVQEVFLLAARSKRLRSHPKPAAWLVTTTKFVCSNYIRTQSRIDRKHEKAAQAVARKNIHCVRSFVEPSTDNTDVSDVMLSLKQSLSPEDYELVKAYCIENRPVAEIAAETGMRESYIRVKIHRLREKIRKSFPDM